MKQSIVKLSVALALLLGTATSVWALPACPSMLPILWTNCIGSAVLPEGATPQNTGDFYEGEWIDGKPNGEGELLFKDGNGGYIGSFKDGGAHGFGTLYVDNGYKYIGDWKFDKRNGYGRETKPNGSTYIGEFKNDKSHGVGVYVGKKYNLTYSGTWKNGNMHGAGTLIFDNVDGKSIVAGTFKNDVWDGYSVILLPDGVTYLGQTVKGKKHGAGIFYNKSGNVDVGLWEDNVFKKYTENFNTPAPKQGSAFMEGLGAFFQALSNNQNSGTMRTQPTQACFKKGEYTSGFNKICKYKCGVSAYAITIANTSLCPLTIQR